MEYYRLILYILLGILPSLIWLFYYVRKDLHPEPKKMIIKVFFYGILTTIPVFFLQLSLSKILDTLGHYGVFDGFPIAADILKWFIVIALTEEILKYLVVRLTVLKGPELDEPLDVMLYMVVVALGFAALENILYLFSPDNNASFSSVLKTSVGISFIRFIGATFLHTLCSSVLGYFIAMSMYNPKEKIRIVITGVSAATILHGFYNFSIIIFESPFNLIVPVSIILSLALFIFYEFSRIGRVKGITAVE